jgi:hypothetical protein
MAGQIFDRLVQRFGKKSLFIDIDNIPFGGDFRRHIDDALKSSDLLIALVGPRWAGGEGKDAKITREADSVRVEIETALKQNITGPSRAARRGEDARAVGTSRKHPRVLLSQCGRVESGRDFDIHVDRLIKAVEQILGCEDLKRVVTEAPSKFASILGPESNAVWIARIQLPGWDEGKTTRYFSCQLPPFTTPETIRAKRDEAAAYVKPCLGPDWTERRAQFSDQSTDITNFKGQDDPVVRLRESYYKDSKDWILRIDIDAPASLATPAPAETPADQPLTTPSPPETAPEAPNQPMIAPPSTY